MIVHYHKGLLSFAVCDRCQRRCTPLEKTGTGAHTMYRALDGEFHLAGAHGHFCPPCDKKRRKEARARG